MCEPDTRNCWVVSDYTVNTVYSSSAFYCLPAFQLQFYWMRRASFLKDYVRWWVSLWRASEWLDRMRGQVFRGQVFLLGYLTKQATNLVIDLLKEYSITCFSSCLSWSCLIITFLHIPLNTIWGQFLYTKCMLKYVKDAI